MAATNAAADRVRARKAEREAESSVIWFKVNGEVFNVSPADFKGRDDVKIRKVTGRSSVAIINDLAGGEVGLDTIAGLMWLSDFQGGDESSAKYDEYLDSVALDTTVEVLDGKPEGVEVPEA